MWTKTFWKDASERIFFTALQALLGVLTATGATPLILDWQVVGITVVVASLGALVKALAAAPANNTVSPASLAPNGGGH